MGRRALITGITGQDGAYLSKFLLEKDYEVYGAYRRSASLNTWRLEALNVEKDVRFVPIDLLEMTNIIRVIEKTRPNEIYNLAAQSFVALSFEQPIYTADVDALGVGRLLESIRSIDPSIRFYQASTSEMFGKVQMQRQNERTAFYPRSPYGIAKVYAHWMTVNYREAYNIHASSGILFNHESPLRGLEFVTRKVTVGIARIRAGQQDTLELGNLDAGRDWGYAEDYVWGMWLMLQEEQAEDYVLATGETHSVRQFVQHAAEAVDMEIVWEGEGKAERGIDRKTGNTVVTINPEFYRPAEVDILTGNATKAHERLGWKPKVSFQALVQMMVDADVKRVVEGTLRS